MKQILLGLLILLSSSASHSYEEKYKSASGYLRMLEHKLDLYAMDNFKRPSTSQGLSILLAPRLNEAKIAGKPYLPVLADDPWGNPYQYEAIGRDYKNMVDRP